LKKLSQPLLPIEWKQRSGRLRNVALPNDVKGEMIIGIKPLVDSIKQDVLAMKMYAFYIHKATNRDIFKGRLAPNAKDNKELP